MKFFSEEKELSVFHHRKKIANFTKGEFETDNERTIELLKPHYKYDKSPRIMSGLAAFLKLKKEAIDKGVYKKGMKKKDIIEILKVGEKNEE
jgi:hypothetical protein